MKNLAGILALILGTIWGPAEGQLLSQSIKAEPSRHSSFEITVWPVVKSKERLNLAKFRYSSPTVRGWGYDAEFSTIEKPNTSAVPLPSRSNHAEFTNTAGKRFELRTNNVQNIEFTLTTGVILDKQTSSMDTRFNKISAEVKMKDHSAFRLQLERRLDAVEKDIKYQDNEIRADTYTSNLLSLGYNGPAKRKLVPYGQLTTGNWLGRSRSSARIGNKIKINKRLSNMADFEINYLADESSKAEVTFLTRVKLSYAISKNLEASIFWLNNSLLELSGTFASLGYHYKNHRFTIEYRELRNSDLERMETSNYLFASRVLFQYGFNLRKS